jgi:putative MFS transporter
VVQIVTVWALGIEPRHRSLEELKGDEAAPAVLKQAS